MLATNELDELRREEAYWDCMSSLERMREPGMREPFIQIPLAFSLSERQRLGVVGVSLRIFAISAGRSIRRYGKNERRGVHKVPNTNSDAVCSLACYSRILVMSWSFFFANFSA